jgi:exodeoxyribonuclease VII large subunit
MTEGLAPTRLAVQVWQVGALCHAISDALQARFNPVRVAGEISGFVRAASGHCYFTLKDNEGQLRCAMFKRAATGLQFVPRDGQRVEVSARVSVYEPRGELQMVVEAMVPAGEGSLYEQFMQIKARLQAQGLFDVERKRPLPAHVRGIGVVTSLGAAALHDVVSALQRRVPHIPVLLAPASVQGAGAAVEIMDALRVLYALAVQPAGGAMPIDVILLVRGGGAMEDLWSFNDEALAQVIAQSPVPLISGVGHETDFTIADFVADMRAPTPTAAAELCAQSTEVLLDAAQRLEDRLQAALARSLERQGQGLDRLAMRLGRPAALVGRLREAWAGVQQRLAHAPLVQLQRQQSEVLRLQTALRAALVREVARLRTRQERLALHLEMLDPRLVLSRGYAWLEGSEGQAITQVAQLEPGQAVLARLSDGVADLQVRQTRPA